jgi:hypothetical protein
MRKDRSAIARVRDIERAPRPYGAAVATAVGALAVGVTALGLIAIGRLAIGSMVLRSGHVRRLVIDDLAVGRLRVVETMDAAPPS